MRRGLRSAWLLAVSIAVPTGLAVVAPAGASVDTSVDISPMSGPPGTEVVVDGDCGDPQFDVGLSVQFRAASESPREPFADPRLDATNLEADPGHARRAVLTPAGAAAGASFFDVLCLNAEGGGIPGTFRSVPFDVTSLPATGAAVAPLLAGGLAAVFVGGLLIVLARPRVRWRRT